MQFGLPVAVRSASKSNQPIIVLGIALFEQLEQELAFLFFDLSGVLAFLMFHLAVPTFLDNGGSGGPVVVASELA